MKYDFYISGPMTGYPNYNFELFNKVADILRDKGLKIHNPAEHYVEGWCIKQYMTVDLNVIINDCDGIVLLPGWHSSFGANVEAFAAFSCGKKAMEIKFHGKTMSFNQINLDGFSLPYTN